jgi:quercetin dioxygenase-like cupin family protein
VRSFEAGTDSSGRSSILRVVDINPTGVTGVWPNVVVNALVSPSGAPVDVGLRPGEARCTTVFFPPGSGVPVGSPRQPSMHWTKTVDFVLVLAGQIRLIVDTGDATMEVGDIAVLPGVTHDWRAGSEGCLLFVLSVGSA